MKLIEFFELEGLFLIYMFVQFVSLLIWSFYLTANLNADLAAASPMVYFLSAIIADFLLCIVIFLVATYFYIRNEEKLVFWLVYSTFTIVLLMFSIKAYMEITSTIIQ